MPFIAPIVAVVATAVGTVGTFVASVGIIGQGLIMAGIGIASSYLISALSPKPQADANQVSGVNFERQYGTHVPRQVACGLIGIAGHDTYINTYNPSNEWLQQIYTVSDYPMTALTRVWAGGIQLELADDDGDSRGQAVTGPSSITFAGRVWIKFLDGRQTDANADLIAHANPSDRWTGAHIGIGVSGVIVTMQYEKDDNNSFPDFFFEFQGAPLYDWRKDSTNGGSGSHRWNNIATHEYSTNPIVMEYNYRRGFSFNDDPFCGMFMDAIDLPVAKFTAAANICDELEDDDLPRYQCSIILDCMRSHSDNLQSLALSCGAMQIDSIDGSWPLVGSDQIVVDEFTDADIISTAQNFKRSEKQSMSTLVNSVSGNYPEPDQLWSMIGYDQQTASEFVVIDRRSRDINMDFPQVPNLRQASQLAWIYLYENRYEAKATVTLRPRFQRLEAGDWVNWNSKRYGLKTFIVTGKQLINLDSGDGPRNVVLTLQERDGEIYSGVTPSIPTLPYPPGEPVYMSEVQSLAAIPVYVTGADGVRQAAIRISWGLPNDVTVVQIDVLYYPTDDPTSAIHKIVTADQTVVVVAEGVVGNTNYTVRTRLITNPPRTVTFDAGVTVNTSDVGFSLANFGPDLRYQITTLHDALNEKINAVADRLSGYIASEGSRNWDEHKSIRSQLSARSDDAFAEIDEVRTIAVDAGLAFASFSLTATAQFGSTTAFVETTATAIATYDEWGATQYSVTLDVNGHAIGFNLINGGAGTSSMVFRADKFQFQFPGYNDDDPFDVVTIGTLAGSPAVGISGTLVLDGTLRATSIEAGSIDTTQLAVNGVALINIIDGATNKAGGGTGTTGVGGGTAAAMELVTIGGRVFVSAEVFPPSGAGCSAVLYVDGVPVRSGAADAPVIFVSIATGDHTYGRAGPVVLQAYVTGLSDANHTFQIDVNTGSTPGVIFAINPRR